MTEKKWQVYVSQGGKVHKYGDPLPQDKAMKVVEDLMQQPNVTGAYMEEEK